MKCKFISTTNSAFEPLLGKEVNLNIGLTASYTFDTEDVPFDFRHGYASTSLIKNINYNEVSSMCFHIEINTLNSKYVFRYGEPSEKKPYSDSEKRAIAATFLI